MRNRYLFFTTIAFCLGFALGALFIGFRIEAKTGQVTVPTKEIVLGVEDVKNSLFPENIKILETRRTVMFDPFLMCVSGLSVGSIFGFFAFLIKVSYPDITYRKILASTWCKNIFWIALFVMTWLAILIIGEMAVRLSVKVNSTNAIYCWRQVIALLSFVIPLIFIGCRFHFSESLKWIKNFMATGIFAFLKTNHLRQSQKMIVWWTMLFVTFILLCPPWIGYKSYSSYPTGEIFRKSQPVFVGFHYMWSVPDPDFASITEVNHHLKNMTILALLVLSGALLMMEMLISKISGKYWSSSWP